MSNRDTASRCPGDASSCTLAMRAVAVAAVAIASMSFVSVAAARGRGCARANTSVTAASRAALQRTVVCLINRQRQSYGLPRLVENSRLNRSAQGWTNTMVAFRDFSHGADFAAR